MTAVHAWWKFCGRQSGRRVATSGRQTILVWEVRGRVRRPGGACSEVRLWTSLLACQGASGLGTAGSLAHASAPISCMDIALIHRGRPGRCCEIAAMTGVFPQHHPPRRAREGRPLSKLCKFRRMSTCRKPTAQNRNLKPGLLRVRVRSILDERKWVKSRREPLTAAQAAARRAARSSGTYSRVT